MFNLLFKRGQLTLNDEELVRLCVHFPKILKTLPVAHITPKLIKKVLLANESCHQSIPDILKDEIFYAIAHAKKILPDISAIPIKFQNDKFYDVLCKVDVLYFKSIPPVHRTIRLCQYVLKKQPNFIDQIPLEVLNHNDMETIVKEVSEVILDKHLRLFKYLPDEHRGDDEGYAKAFAGNHITVNDVDEFIKKSSKSKSKTEQFTRKTEQSIRRKTEQEVYNLAFKANKTCFKVIPSEFKTQDMSIEAFGEHHEVYFEHIPLERRTIEMYKELICRDSLNNERGGDLLGRYTVSSSELCELPSHFTEEEYSGYFPALLEHDKNCFFEIGKENITPAVCKLVSQYLLTDDWVRRGSIAIIKRLPREHTLVFEEALKATPSALFLVPEKYRTSTMYIISKDYLKLEDLQNLPVILNYDEKQQLYLNGISKFPYLYLTLPKKHKTIAVCQQAFLYNSITQTKFKQMFPRIHNVYDKYDRAFAPHLEQKENIPLRHCNYKNLKDSFPTEEFAPEVYYSAVRYKLETLENVPAKYYKKLFYKLLQEAIKSYKWICESYHHSDIFETASINYESEFDLDELYDSSIDDLFFKFPQSWMKSHRDLYEKVISLRPHLFKYVPETLQTETMWAHHVIELSNQKNAQIELENVLLKFRNTSFYHQLVKLNPNFLSKMNREYRTARICAEAVTNTFLDPTCIDLIDIFKNIPKRHRSIELCRYVITLNSETFKYVPRNLRTASLNRLAITEKPSLFKHVPKKRRTIELCRLAIELDAENIKHVPKIYRLRSVFKAELQKSPTLLPTIPLKLRTREACLKFFCQSKLDYSNKADASQIFLITPKFFIDESFIKELIQVKPNLFNNIPSQYLTVGICEFGVKSGLVMPTSVPLSIRNQNNYLNTKYTAAIKQLALIKKVKNNILEINRQLNTLPFENIQQKNLLHVFFKEELIQEINDEYTLHFMSDEDKEAFDNAGIYDGNELPRYITFNDEEVVLLSANSFFNTDDEISIELIYMWSIDWQFDEGEWFSDWEENQRENGELASEPPFIPPLEGHCELYILFEIKLTNSSIDAAATAVPCHSTSDQIPDKIYFNQDSAHTIDLDNYL
jgi:hypothetical protein